MPLPHQPGSRPGGAFLVAVLFVLAGTNISRAPSYAIDWYKIGGAGGSSGGAYQVTGTIGQADASPTIGGGNYSLSGGFASIISVLQTAELPALAISHTGQKVRLVWPNSTRCTLMQTSDPAGGTWIASSYAIATANGTNSVTLDAPVGKMFFRLTAP